MNTRTTPELIPYEVVSAALDLIPEEHALVARMAIDQSMADARQQSIDAKAFEHKRDIQSNIFMFASVLGMETASLEGERPVRLHDKIMDGSMFVLRLNEEDLKIGAAPASMRKFAVLYVTQFMVDQGRAKDEIGKYLDSWGYTYQSVKDESARLHTASNGEESTEELPTKSDWINLFEGNTYRQLCTTVISDVVAAGYTLPQLYPNGTYHENWDGDLELELVPPATEANLPSAY